MLASIGSVGKAMARPWSCCGRGQRRPGRVAGVFGAVVALAMAVAACTSGSSGSASAGASHPALSSAGACAWPIAASVKMDNAALVDAAAAYWLQPIMASGGTRIVVSGRYPDARYASLSVYEPNGNPVTGNGVSSSLPDYRIVPQPGSQNPWQQLAAPGGRYTVTIRPDASRGQVNTLPLPSGSTSQHPGFLQYRVYLPGAGDFSDLPLPVVTVEQGGAARVLPACPRHSGQHRAAVPAPATGSAAAPRPAPAGAGTGRPASVPPPLEFFKVTQVGAVSFSRIPIPHTSGPTCTARRRPTWSS